MSTVTDLLDLLQSVLEEAQSLQADLRKALTGDADVLALAEAPTGRHHLIEPGEDAILFGADGRELDHVRPLAFEYPLQSTCRCGRQIMKERGDGEWTHVD